MPYSVEGKLVVAISSRALLDFEDENRVFERDGEGAYIALQLARLDVPAREGVAFALVKKLLAFNMTDPAHPVLIGFHPTETNPRALAVVSNASFKLPDETLFAGDILVAAGGGARSPRASWCSWPTRRRRSS